MTKMGLDKNDDELSLLIEELDRPPVEVFAAIDGNWKALAKYLRNEEHYSLYTIVAIAAWMAGDLPPRRSAGNPRGSNWDKARSQLVRQIALTEYQARYLQAGRPRGRAEAISDQVASDYKIDPQTFSNFRRRNKKQRPAPISTVPYLEEMYWEWKRSSNSQNKKN